MARGKKNKPEIDICRVRTDRLREMTPKQLDRAADRVGPLHMIPQKQRGEKKPRYLLSKFITDIRNSKTIEELSPRSREAYIRNYGEEPAPASRIRDMYKREVDRAERLIWQMQQKRGCKLPGSEVVARDAIMEAEHRGEKPDQDLIDKIRGKRRPKIR